MRLKLRSLAVAGAALTVALLVAGAEQARAQLVVSTPGVSVGVGVPAVGVYPGYGVVPGYGFGYVPPVAAYPVVRPYPVYRPGYYGYGPRAYAPAYRGWHGGYRRW